MSEIAPLVTAAARKRLLFLPHAVRQMSRPDRMISVQEVRRAVLRGEITEDYPEDARGHSCLMSGTGEAGRKIHVVCSPRGEANTSPSLRRTSRKQTNGMRSSGLGGLHEVHVLPGEDEENSGALSYRPQGLSSILGSGSRLGMRPMRRTLLRGARGENDSAFAASGGQ